MAITLWHIPLSHYNEKARWALDFKGLAHRRRVAPTGLHGPYAMWLTRSRHRRFPVLVLDGRAIGDSTAIIAALERHAPAPALYPADPGERRRALELEERFDEILGPAVRRFAWHHILGQQGGLADALTPHASEERKRALNRLAAVFAPVMRRDYDISADSAARARREIVATMDLVEAELGPEGHLVGERFSVADLTAAALFTPLLAPPERPYAPVATPPAALLELREELEARPGGRWVFDTYARHRRSSAAVAAA